MKKLLLKLLLAASPVFMVLILYCYTDPFKVIYHYSKFQDKEEIAHVALNKDYTSTETFVRNLPMLKYDAYIFGNSRSRYYSIREWQRYIGQSSCFHFDASHETLYGLERKVNLIHTMGGSIHNALIILDAQLLAGVGNSNEHLYRKHPLLSGENRLSFQLLFVKTFLDPDFMMPYIRYTITHKPTQQMIDKGVLDNTPLHNEEDINEETTPLYERQIAHNRDSFYAHRMRAFYHRDTIQTYSQPVIGPEQKELLQHIAAILAAGKTNYEVVISPLYDQKKLAAADIAYLSSLFGKEHVHDFSGINDLTATIYNYYEDSHYRPHVASEIMRRIYGKHP